MVVAGPHIISRGFVYVREAEELIGEVKTIVRKLLKQCEENHVTEWFTIKTSI